MRQFFLQVFTWWNGQTLGTRVFTLRKGVCVGEDGNGNIYYCEREGKRRWVIYNGVVEATAVPPEWHGWLHHTTDKIPVKCGPCQPNMTGTSKAYRPKGYVLESGGCSSSADRYQAWRPDL